MTTQRGNGAESDEVSVGHPCAAAQPTGDRAEPGDAHADAHGQQAEGQPLTGRRVLVPRGGAWGQRVAAMLRARGAEPVIAPLITMAPPLDERALQRRLDELAAGSYQLLAVTSQNAAAVLGRHGVLVPDVTRVAAVGAATAQALQEVGISVDLLPALDAQNAHGLAALIGRAPAAGARALLPASALAHATLRDSLSDAGWVVDTVTAYRPVGVALEQEALEDVRRGAVDAVLVTSGTVAQQVAIQFGAASRQTLLVSIGAQTTADAQALGLDVAATAEHSSLDGLLDALQRLTGTHARTGAATTISKAPSAHGRL